MDFSRAGWWPPSKPLEAPTFTLFQLEEREGLSRERDAVVAEAHEEARALRALEALGPIASHVSCVLQLYLLCT